MGGACPCRLREGERLAGDKLEQRKDSLGQGRATCGWTRSRPAVRAGPGSSRGRGSLAAGGSSGALRGPSAGMTRVALGEGWPWTLEPAWVLAVGRRAQVLPWGPGGISARTGVSQGGQAVPQEPGDSSEVPCLADARPFPPLSPQGCPLPSQHFPGVPGSRFPRRLSSSSRPHSASSASAFGCVLTFLFSYTSSLI